MTKIFNYANLIKLSIIEILWAKISLAELPRYGPENFAQLICQITCFLQPIIIVLAVLMIILSGFQFVTAQGNEEKIKKAKDTFKWTVIGVAIIIGARLIITILAEILGGGSISCGC